jgi:serine phosphatase RsbU (regulator of sigma subunit)
MPRLLLVQGAQHSAHELTSTRNTVGSLAENDIVVQNDAGVSRRHCEISQKKGTWVLRDRGSRNGTWLNGERIEDPVKLTYGDRVGLGPATVLIFLSSAGASVGGRDPETVKRLNNLVMLQEITKAINSETDLNQLLELIMDTAIHLIHADRGFLIFLEEEQLEFKVARNIDYQEVRSPKFKISNTTIRKVAKTGQPVLTSNAQHDLRDAKSIAELEVRALMCVPLRVKSEIKGVLYFDGKSVESRFDENGLELLVAFSDQAAIAIEKARLLQQSKEKEAILSELRVASRIQLALLPREAPELPGWQLAGTMKTAREVGGDYFDYIPGPQVRGGRNLYLAIGDVSGKGVPAGLVMVMARSIIRSLVGRGAAPRDVLREGNRLLKQDLKPGMFMSMLLAYVDVGTGRMLLSGCGHERPLIYRARQRRIERIDLGGLVLGVVPDISPHLEEQQLNLDPGDLVLLYTDGVTEAMDVDRTPYGMDRLERFLAKNGHQSPERFVKALVDDLELHQAGAEQHDDITLIAARRA